MDQFQVLEKLQFKHLLFIDKDWHEKFALGVTFIFSLTMPIDIEVKIIIFTELAPRLGCVA